MATKEELIKQAEKIFGVKITSVESTDSEVIFQPTGKKCPIRIRK